MSQSEIWRDISLVCYIFTRLNIAAHSVKYLSCNITHLSEVSPISPISLELFHAILRMCMFIRTQLGYCNFSERATYSAYPIQAKNKQTSQEDHVFMVPARQKCKRINPGEILDQFLVYFSVEAIKCSKPIT